MGTPRLCDAKMQFMRPMYWFEADAVEEMMRMRESRAEADSSCPESEFEPGLEDDAKVDREGGKGPDDEVDDAFAPGLSMCMRLRSGKAKQGKA